MSAHAIVLYRRYPGQVAGKGAGPMRTFGSSRQLERGSRMKIHEANTEAPRGEMLRDADEIHSRELRKTLEKYIEAQKQQLKALRRLLN